MKPAGLKIALLAAFCVLGIHAAYADGVPDAASRCEALRTLDLPGLRVDSSKLPAPEYCRVTGKIDRARFELHLPTTQWNGKYYMAGCGSLCGVIDNATPAYKAGVAHGYATITSDAGHQSWTPLGSAWARDDQRARDDHAWRAVHRTAGVGRRITEAYYGGPVQHAYFNGCSNGGRQALMEAARFPQDFDGIIAESPAQSVLPILMVYTYALLADTGADGKDVLDRRKIPLLHQAVLKACGDASGVVTDPQSCTFDPATLQCPQGDGPDCLSAAEVRTVRALYAGPPPSDAYKALGGVPRGSEQFWTPRAELPLLIRAIWAFQAGPRLDATLAPLKIGAAVLARDVMATPAFDKNYDARKFDPARDLPRLEQYSAEMTPARDLGAFHARGGKLVLVQSTADTAVPPPYTLDYWREASANLGAGAADTLRMFMVPGMGHCTNGEGPQLPGYNAGDYDPLSALEGWVERGSTPDALTATRRDAGSGQVTRSELLCALPAHAVYSGAGDRKDPTNWACR